MARTALALLAAVCLLGASSVRGQAAATTTTVALSGTAAVATITEERPPIGVAADLVHLCPQGTVCWSVAVGGPCLANTTVVPETLGNLFAKQTTGQATFDYATVLPPGTAFTAVATYSGSSGLCNAAPSDNSKQLRPQPAATLVDTTITVALFSPSVPAVKNPTTNTFSATLRSAADGTPVVGATISFDFGDKTAMGSGTTNASGIATAMHDYTTAGQVTVTAAFGGNAVYAAKSGSTTITVGLFCDKKAKTQGPNKECFSASASGDYGCLPPVGDTSGNAYVERFASDTSCKTNQECAQGQYCADNDEGTICARIITSC